MKFLILISLLYYFGWSYQGRRWTGIIVKSVMFYTFIFVNPVTIVLFGGLYLLLKGHN